MIKPHCPVCGYTKEDAAIHMDHHLCKGKIPGTKPRRGINLHPSPEVEYETGPMVIYTASKTKHADKWRALRAAGHLINATWIDEAGPGESNDLPGLAQRCIAEASNSSFVLLYVEPGETLKGALVEVGAALACGVPIHCVGSCPSTVSVFAHHPLWCEFASIDDALLVRKY